MANHIRVLYVLIFVHLICPFQQFAQAQQVSQAQQVAKSHRVSQAQDFSQAQQSSLSRLSAQDSINAVAWRAALVTWKDKSAVAQSDGLSSAAEDGILHLGAAKGGIYHYQIAVADDKKNVGSFRAIQVAISNSGTAISRVSASLNDKAWFGGSVLLAPGESDTLEIWFIHPLDSAQKIFVNMDGLPGGNASIWDPIDPAALKTITLEIKSDGAPAVSLGTVFTAGQYQSVAAVASDAFFPFIDMYGQFAHAEWPGKIHTEAELKSRLEKEKAELSIFTGPAAFDRFGGWQDGPQLEASGYFRTEKVEGKWWLVDPDGHLFWSHGVNCVGFDSGVTEIGGRERYFKDLPVNSGAGQSFYTNQHGKTRFNYYSSNLFHKYGAEWHAKATATVFERLHSWGINTIGNWSDPGIYLSRTGLSACIKKLPYTVNVDYSCKAVDGKNFKFPDVFDKGFMPAVTAAAQKAALKTGSDPYCMGYFVDNELKLLQLTAACMKQSEEGAAKNAFVAYLKSKFTTISALNASWGTQYGSWHKLLPDTLLPKSAGPEMSAFDSLMIDRYYAFCRTAMKAAAPGQLYLGSRFNLYRIYYPKDTSLNSALRIAANYCDVVSINYYRYGSEDLVLPAGVDKPIIIGEFHFGAPDRGLPHSGLRNAHSQLQRAKLYQVYVEESLHNPQIVGTHWFQYGDQPYTGRFDGENYQIGFVDIGDHPYPETVGALRQIGYNMYRMRFATGK